MADGNPRPFSNGTDGYDWLAANCDRCAKRGEPDAHGDGPCPMETAVSRGFLIGTVPASLAIQYGATNHRHNDHGEFITMPRQCSQFVNAATTCEYLKKAHRTNTECGQPATAEHVADSGLHFAVCAKHAAMVATSTQGTT